MINACVVFEKITKFPLANYLQEIQDFLQFSYPRIVDYFSGKIQKIEQRHIKKREELLNNANKISELFKLNREKFVTVDFWELLVLLEDFRSKLETIGNISKYLRSSRTNFNFDNSSSFPFTMGQQQTLEQISNNILKDQLPEDDWVKISLKNDLQEVDWDIDGGTEVTLFKERFISNFVTSVIDNMIGEKIYGKDIKRKLTFENNDLVVLSYKETVYQTVEILAMLKKGDIPEFPSLGINASLYAGANIRGLTYSSVIRDMRRNFQTDDLFQDFEVLDIKYDNGNLFIEFKVKTKYDLFVQKTAVL